MAKGIDPIRLIASILLSRALALPALPVHTDPGVNRDLFEAARRGNASEVKAALAAGADPGARDEYGDTPFDYAKDNETLKGTPVYWLLHDARFE